ncbi:MAG TPA: RluA family pseudouridine synthase [Blastocatellia bacterium]|nr:RluA family pseudouridine synthase [Blastocatellia bacterium]
MEAAERVSFEFEAGPGKERLDHFLAARLPALSLTRLRRAVEAGDARVNGEASAQGARLQSGDRVSLVIAAGDRTATTPEPIALEILYEDSDLIVINKPAGLLAHPSRTEKSGTLTNALAYHFMATSPAPVRPGLVHRLDRDTSGAIAVAKTPRAHRILAKAFRQRRVEKRYLALVVGRVSPDAGEVSAPIGRDAASWPRWQVTPDGRPAQTRFAVRLRFAAHTLLGLEPLTGRTHQLRIHCAALGHPVVGDRVYGATDDALARALGLTHHLLHARELSFRHPGTGAELSFTAPLPPAVQRSLELLAEGDAGDARL